MRILSLIGIGFAAVLLPACNGKAHDVTPAAPDLFAGGSSRQMIPNSLSLLYVANRAGNQILGFAQTAFGNVSPNADIVGNYTQLNLPIAVANDANRRIFVGNDSDTKVLRFAAGANGNVAPTAVISGSKTKFGSIDGIAIDAAGHVWVATYRPTPQILEFSANAKGNAAPIHTISGSNTRLDGPDGMTFDSAGNLYVSNVYDSAILVFAAGSYGDVAPIAEIVGSKTKLNWPVAVRVHSSRIVVANEMGGGSITAYKLTANGNAAPVWRIAGSMTGLTAPGGLTFDTAGDLFATDSSDAILEFAPGATGNVAPIATIREAIRCLAIPSARQLYSASHSRSEGERNLPKRRGCAGA